MAIIIKGIRIRDKELQIRFGDKTTIYFSRGRKQVERFIQRSKEDPLTRMALKWVLDQVDNGVIITDIKDKRFFISDVLVEDA